MNKIIFLCFNFFSWKIIFPFLNDPFNNNIAIHESKIIYFCLRPNFYGTHFHHNTRARFSTYISVNF